MIRRKFNLLVAACALTGAAGVRAAGFDVEGKFQRVVPNQPTETPRGVIEVVDIFGYRCPHCFSFLPVLERFENEVPDDVHVRHMPVIFRDSWEAPARAFYTAKLLGVLDRVHRPIFEALHVDRRTMDSDDAWRNLFAEHGVSNADFDKTFNSFAVQSMLRKSQVMQRRYGVTATPSVIVNGKYRVPAGLAGSFENMIEVTKGLIALERRSLQSTG
ncbi:MAG TPA: thiol:disulfide interchange protein DsbA/DsbL [Gammaproteobacteria bacterium]|nr:thiol:disulfide interchange protein DsbA/DsbL [Gammaproteobacteria bacterium]